MHIHCLLTFSTFNEIDTIKEIRRDSNYQRNTTYFKSVRKLVSTLFKHNACMLFLFQDQYRVLYFALMEAFCGPPKSVTKETFLSKYHGKSSFHNDGKVSQTVNLATEFEVFIRLHKAYK